MKAAYALCAVLMSGTCYAQNQPCLYNPATRLRQVCLHVTASGGCVHFAQTCGVDSQTPLPPDTRTCLHATADGGCAHYADPGVQQRQCMFNPGTRSYQRCEHATATGQCVHFSYGCKIVE
jgi:hypothetical protein